MKQYFQIELTKGMVARVSPEDWPEISEMDWHASWDRNSRSYYAISGSVSTKRIRMSRLIMKAPSGVLVDHIFGDTLDNRRENLRFATVSQNTINSRVPSTNTSGVKGVCWSERLNLWRVHIQAQGKRVWVGTYAFFADAVEARRNAEERYHGDFVRRSRS